MDYPLDTPLGFQVGWAPIWHANDDTEVSSTILSTLENGSPHDFKSRHTNLRGKVYLSLLFRHA